MEKVFKVLIFTDLDGSLLHRDTFKFDEIKDYIRQLISKGIFIIPNTSKTEKEILEFNSDLGSSLPFISENGATINGLDLLNKNLPQELILSREKEILLAKRYVFYLKILNFHLKIHMNGFLVLNLVILMNQI